MFANFPFLYTLILSLTFCFLLSFSYNLKETVQHTNNEYMSYVTGNKSIKYMSLPNKFKCNLWDKKTREIFQKAGRGKVSENTGAFDISDPRRNSSLLNETKHTY